MLLTLRNKKGQYMLEYAVFIAVIALALAALYGYLQKTKQGDLRSSAEDMGDPFNPTGVGRTDISSSSSYTEDIATGATGKIKRTEVKTSSTTARSGGDDEADLDEIDLPGIEVEEPPAPPVQ